MPLEAVDQAHLCAAHGYIELGLFVEANEELEKLQPSYRHAPEVLDSRVVIYQGLEKWELMAIVARRLAEWNPREAGYFLHLAYASRRAVSLRAAHAILIRAAALHPGEGLIQFNLGCYEWQLGNLVQAKAYLKRATKIDAKFKQMALDDFDLKPLWASLAIEHTKAKASSRPLLGRKRRLITRGPRRRMWGRDPSILRRFSRRRQDHCRR